MILPNRFTKPTVPQHITYPEPPKMIDGFAAVGIGKVQFPKLSV